MNNEFSQILLRELKLRVETLDVSCQRWLQRYFCHDKCKFVKWHIWNKYIFEYGTWRAECKSIEMLFLDSNLRFVIENFIHYLWQHPDSWNCFTNGVNRITSLKMGQIKWQIIAKRRCCQSFCLLSCQSWRIIQFPNESWAKTILFVGTNSWVWLQSFDHLNLDKTVFGRKTLNFFFEINWSTAKMYFYFISKDRGRKIEALKNKLITKY